jgi:hypothetical protein
MKWLKHWLKNIIREVILEEKAAVLPAHNIESATKRLDEHLKRLEDVDVRFPRHFTEAMRSALESDSQLAKQLSDRLKA